MELTILGSGTAALSLRRGPSGYLLTVGCEHYLLDGGSGTLLKCLKAGISYRMIDRLFYTHLHPDHTMDFIPFLFATKYTPGFRRQKRLDIYGPRGFSRFYQDLATIFDPGLLELDFDVQITELGNDRRTVETLVIESGLMKHSKDAIGYRFECNGKVLVYSGDTDRCEEIIHLARHADVLILECSFPDEMKIPKHLTPSEAGQIAEKAHVGKLVLTHFYPPCDEIDVKGIAKRQFSGDVIVAEDLMKITL